MTRRYDRAMTQPEREPGTQSPSKFREKLGMYLTGVAIGFLLLGFFMYQKHRAQQASAQGTPQTEPAP